MFRFLKSRKAKPARRIEKNRTGGGANPGNQTAASPVKPQQVLSRDLSANLATFRSILDGCIDIISREFVLAQNEQIKLALFYSDGTADKSKIADLIRSLTMEIPKVVASNEITKSQALDFIMQRGVCQYSPAKGNDVGDLVGRIFSGEAILLIDGHAEALVIEVRNWEKRSIPVPEVEVTVRGPQEGFTETLMVNVSLLRRKIQSPDLKMKAFTLGRITHTMVLMTYVQGVASEELIQEVTRRLERIDIDGILDSGYIEEFIEDNPWSPFPTINHTQRPDKLAALLLEGRVGVMVEGTPFVLTMPNLFIEYLQAGDDYYERALFASAVRVIRLLAMVISLILPSLYVAITTFHPALLPTSLLLNFAAQRDSVPFPAFVAVAIMEFFFEILREAGIRLPRAIGAAVSIVGALVIGDAAVRAGLVAASTVIVVALTGICSFTFTYSSSFAFRMLRFPLLILSGFTGLLGMSAGLVAIVTHLATLRSFGVPYLAPFAPTIDSDFKDVLRVPWWAMLTRPKLIGGRNPHRQKPGLKPSPPPTQNDRSSKP